MWTKAGSGYIAFVLIPRIVYTNPFSVHILGTYCDEVPYPSTLNACSTETAQSKREAIM